MTTIMEAFFFCLLASLVWAPAVFLFTARFEKRDQIGFADKVWPFALLLAGLPAIFAPFAATFGLSLRTPAPLPPMAAPVTDVEFIPSVTTATVAAPVTNVNVADIFAAGAALYFYGFLLFFALGFIRMIWFSYRVRYAFELDEPRLKEGLDNWRERMGVKSSPRYAFTDAVSSVCVHGFIRPVILMPMNLLDKVSIEDATLMGAHEMAHIRRGDTWLFAFASAMKAVFWFNPFIHRIAARANLAAEQAADALVINAGASRRDYAKCFVQGLRFAAGASRPEQSLVPSFTPFDKRSRRERLDAILSKTGATPFLTFSNKVAITTSILIAAALAFAQAALAVTPKPPKDALPAAPIEGNVTIGLGYGEKSPLLGPDRPAHEGIDIRAPHGAAVRAAGGGKVIDATNRYKGQEAWGNVVVIDHGHGLVTRYAHLDRFNVEKGDRVDAGEMIGNVGSTGKATGPHLHFEVLQDGATIDPSPVVSVAPLPAAKPAVTSSRVVQISPAREFEPAPLAESLFQAEPNPKPPVAPELPSLNKRFEDKLVRKMTKLDEKLRTKLKDHDANFDAHDFDFNMGDFDVSGMEAFAETFGEEFGEYFSENFSEKFAEMDFPINAIGEIEINIPDAVYGLDGEELTDRERAEIKRAHQQVIEQANQARSRALRQMDRAERQRERALRNAERLRERALERAEHQQKDARRQRDLSQREQLDLQAEALNRAYEEIERQREEIERKREQLREKLESLDED